MPLPSPCPCCGTLSLPPAERWTTLFAVCDVLTIKSLEQLGKYLVRAPVGDRRSADRSRYATLGDTPFREAHTIWRAPDALVDKALRGAWDVVPAIIEAHLFPVDACEVVETMDQYVHDLAITGTPHTQQELAYRFTSRLALPVMEAAWA
jgi:hypothetical protein